MPPIIVYDKAGNPVGIFHPEQPQVRLLAECDPAAGYGGCVPVWERLYLLSSESRYVAVHGEEAQNDRGKWFALERARNLSPLEATAWLLERGRDLPAELRDPPAGAPAQDPAGDGVRPWTQACDLTPLQGRLLEALWDTSRPKGPVPVAAVVAAVYDCDPRNAAAVQAKRRALRELAKRANRGLTTASVHLYVEVHPVSACLHAPRT
jgi:hypothetical protein